MTTWADVEKGTRILMGGKPFEVVKAKRRGKKIDVKVKSPAGTFASTVRAKDAVELEPLREPSGRQKRWATRAEHDEEERAPMLGAGNPAVTKPPKKAKAGAWDGEPRDEAEAVVREELGAVLVAETDDEASGWYVPPIDASTVAMHLLTFHGRTPFGSEADMLATHDEEHRLAEANATLLATNHWHTTERRMKP